MNSMPTTQDRVEAQTQQPRTDADRRPRVPFSDVVLITSTQSVHTIAARGHDLTPLGVAVSTDKQLPIGGKVSVWINLGRNVGLVRCDAVVRHSHGFRHGCQFQELSAEQTDLLERICRQLELRA